jgi:hypothetical protein
VTADNRIGHGFETLQHQLTYAPLRIVTAPIALLISYVITMFLFLVIGDVLLPKQRIRAPGSPVRFSFVHAQPLQSALPIGAIVVTWIAALFRERRRRTAAAGEPGGDVAAQAG